jgi:hypothetical protein
VVVHTSKSGEGDDAEAEPKDITNDTEALKT